jgi:phage replication-related protein YjqB (UPF0714/DUF867 family)
VDNTGGMSFTELLAQPGVHEEVELRGRFGFLAFHGGPVERVTSLVAREAAARSGASFYSIDQPDDRPLHIPSTRFRPEESDHLASVIDHVDVVCAVHGYGRDMDKQHLLLGGQNRGLAEQLGENLSSRLHARFRVVTDIDEIPRELRGVHGQNPVNLPRRQGVQLELPPGVRWNWEARNWADADGLDFTNEVQALIDALAQTATEWMAQAEMSTDGS